MDIKLLLIKTLTLLYRESELGNDVSEDLLINDFLKAIEIPNTLIEASSQLLVNLRLTAIEMTEATANGPLNKEDLLQRVRVNVENFEYLYEALKTGIDRQLDEDQALKACAALRQELLTARRKNKVKKLLHDAYVQATFREAEVDWKNFLPELTRQLEENGEGDAGLGELRLKSMISQVDFSDKAAVRNVLIEGKQSVFGDGIMKTGWQGFNDMLEGGLRRGELVVIGALRSNYKSGMLLNIPRHVAIYNKPYMIDPTKKPLILYISLENDVEKNVIDLYKKIWEEDHQKPLNVSEMTEDMIAEAAEIINEKMSVNGYTYRMLRMDSNTINYEDFFAVIRYFESQNYEIHLISLDYMNNMQKDGCSGSLMAERIRDLYRRCRNFCNPRKITLLTAHQLDSQATYLKREGNHDFVQRVAGGSYYLDCKSVDHEIDVEIIINMERPGDGHTYLAAMCGKHRGPFDMSRPELLTVYRFEDYAGLHDDINGQSQARKEVGGATVTSGGERPFWSLSQFE